VNGTLKFRNFAFLELISPAIISLMKKFTLLLLLFFSSLLLTQAQSLPGFGGGGNDKIYDGKIYGVIFDSLTRKPVELANIAIYNTGSDKPLDGTVTNDKGDFKFKNLKNGKYKVVASFLGFETRTIDSIEISDNKLTAAIGKIFIRPNARLLKEAVIETEAPLIETKIDKIVYNADKDMTSKGGNATDVLRKVPMVTVDLDGNPSMQGSTDVKVLINNKPSSIMASSISDALKMIPAYEIEKVEVITSPSAKYDAEGTGGIINIITKKKNIEGLSGAVNAGAGTRSSNLFGNLNYRSGRWGNGLNVGGFGWMGHGDISTTRTTDFSTLMQSGPNKSYGLGPFVQWTSDYDISSKNNLSSSLRVRDFYMSTTSDIENDLAVDPNRINFKELYLLHNESATNGFNYDASLDYKHTYKTPDKEWTGSAQITNNSRKTNYDIDQKDSLGNPFFTESSENTNVNREITLQTDYVNPFSKLLTLETGAKTILRHATSDYNYLYHFISPELPDSSPSSTFDYDQTIYAGYVQGALTLKRFGIKTGLRYEKTDVTGQTQDSSRFTNGYENYIPSATISYRKPGKYSIKLAYTQRLQRPSMNFLNPYVNKSDALNISYGNPNLSAERSHSFELGYSLFKSYGSMTAAIFHRFTENSIEKIIRPDPVYREVLVTTYDNIGKNNSTGMSLNTNVIKTKLIVSLNFNIYYYKVNSSDTAATGGLSYNDGINYDISLFGSYKFTSHWGVQSFGHFSGPKFSVQGKSTSFFYYNMSVRREFNNENGGIGLGVDNFASPYMHFRNDYTGSNFTYHNDNKIYWLGLRVSFDYRFGKMNFNSGKKKGIKNDDLKEGDDNMQMGGGGGK